MYYVVQYIIIISIQRVISKVITLFICSYYYPFMLWDIKEIITTIEGMKETKIEKLNKKNKTKKWKNNKLVDRKKNYFFVL